MATRDRGTVLKSIDTLFQAGTTGALGDGELLGRFLGGTSAGAEAAFAAIVERHGPMVLRVCRGQLRDTHAAEDAFQATFLILARKAATIRTRVTLASWLYSVARHVARQAARNRRRALKREQSGAAMQLETSRAEGPPELLPEIQEEVDRLPEKYRAVVVLCYLEGQTHEQAAGQLRLPVGTVKVRLARARERLRGRFVRRGLAPGVLLAALSEQASAALPTPLVESTTHAALQVAAGQAAAVSGTVAALVHGVLRAMLYAKLKVAAACVAASLCLLISSVLMVASLPRAARSALAQDGEKVKAPVPPLPPVPRNEEAAQKEKTVKVAVDTVTKTHFVLTTSQPGTVQAVREIDIYPGIAGIQELKVDVGDKVKQGDLIASIAVPELMAEFNKARAVVEQAQTRVERTLIALKAASALAKTEGDAKRITAEADVAEAKAQVNVAQAELNLVETRLLGARIHSPLGGIVSRRNFHGGDFVRSGTDNGAKPIVTVIQTDKVRVVVQVPDNDVPLLDKGDPATLNIEAHGATRVYKGVISRMSYAEDPQTRTMRAEIDLDNPDGKLRPGQYGIVTIGLEDSGERLTMPTSAIVRPFSPSEPWCVRVVDGRAVRTRVKIGEESGARTEVLDGLNEGDRVVVQDVATLKDGQPVELKAGEAERPKR